MNKEILYTILLAFSFLALFGVAEILYHKFRVKAELTRKSVHFGTGILALFFPILLNNHWLVLFLCASFAGILLISLKFNLLKSINAIDRVSHGSISYPVSVYGCYLAYNYFNHQYIYFYLPILILSVCDPLAALTGKKYPKGKYTISNDNKTLMGSSVFFFSAFVIYIVLFLLLGRRPISPEIALYGLIIALISCIAEAISNKGFDNLTIPFSVLIGLVLSDFIQKLWVAYG